MHFKTLRVAVANADAFSFGTLVSCLSDSAVVLFAFADSSTLCQQGGSSRRSVNKWSNQHIADHIDRVRDVIFSVWSKKNAATRRGRNLPEATETCPKNKLDGFKRNYELREITIRIVLVQILAISLKSEIIVAPSATIICTKCK